MSTSVRSMVQFQGMCIIIHVDNWGEPERYIHVRIVINYIIYNEKYFSDDH